MPANATEERRRLLRLYGAEIVESPAGEGSNGAVRLALELAEREPRYFMPFQYANEANPRAHYEGTGAEIAEALDRVDVLVAGPRHRRHADGRRRAAARVVPGRRRRRGRAAARRSGDGPALARGRLRAADPRRLEARPEGARLERRVGRRRCARCSTERASSPASPPAPSSTSRASSRRSSTRASSSASSPTPAGSTSRADFWDASRRRSVAMERVRLVVIPAEVRAAARGARARRGAERGLRARRRSETASPSATSRPRTPPRARTASSSRSSPRTGSSRTRATSSPSSTRTSRRPPRPSRTDVENIGLWEGRPYLILSLGTGELAAWRIAGGEVSPLALEPLEPRSPLKLPFMPSWHGRARCRCRCTSCPS